jgi:hypothetical protein
MSAAFVLQDQGSGMMGSEVKGEAGSPAEL